VRRAFCDLGLHLWGKHLYALDAIACVVCGRWYPCETRWTYEHGHGIESGGCPSRVAPAVAVRSRLKRSAGILASC
jgi:hypothetical protein